MPAEYPLEISRSEAGEECPLIAHYAAIADASRVMLDAARRDDWDEVERLEGQCRALIDRLSVAKSEGALPNDDRDRRMALLRAILSDDAEIRDRSEPWMRSIETLLAVRSRPFR